MYCTKCGNVIPEESLVCGYCGQPVEEAEEQTAPEQQTAAEQTAVPSTGEGEEDTPEQEADSLPEQRDEEEPEQEPQEPMVDISDQATGEPQPLAEQPLEQEEPPADMEPPVEQAPPPPVPERRVKPVAALPLDKRARPVKTAGFFFTELLLLIPVINIILLFVWAFRKKANLNRKAFARSLLIWILIGLLALLAALIAVIALQIPTDINYWIDQLKSAVNSIPHVG